MWQSVVRFWSDENCHEVSKILSLFSGHSILDQFTHSVTSTIYLNFQTRIFVTHNITYLSQAEHIFVLNNGHISESGTYNELLKAGGDFAGILATHVKENDQSLFSVLPQYNHTSFTKMGMFLLNASILQIRRMLKTVFGSRKMILLSATLVLKSM